MNNSGFREIHRENIDFISHAAGRSTSAFRRMFPTTLARVVVQTNPGFQRHNEISDLAVSTMRSSRPSASGRAEWSCIERELGSTEASALFVLSENETLITLMVP